MSGAFFQELHCMPALIASVFEYRHRFHPIKPFLSVFVPDQGTNNLHSLVYAVGYVAEVGGL